MLAYVVAIMSGMSGAGVKLTYEDFLLLPDDGKRHELIDGEHYVTPSPSDETSTYLRKPPLADAFLSRGAPGWRSALRAARHRLSNFDVVEPDLLYLSHERGKTVITEKHARGAPELVIEIASKGTRKRDETIKRRLYERSGVDEYWVL